MTIAEIIRNGRGTAHAWHVESDPSYGEDVRALYHYTTRMAEWDHKTHEVLWTGLGWGSVSDQNGLNTLFRVLGAPYYFARDWRGGGARVENVTTKLAA